MGNSKLLVHPSKTLRVSRKAKNRHCHFYLFAQSYIHFWEANGALLVVASPFPSALEICVIGRCFARRK